MVEMVFMFGSCVGGFLGDLEMRVALSNLLFDTQNVDKTCLSTKFVYKPARQMPPS